MMGDHLGVGLVLSGVVSREAATVAGGTALVLLLGLSAFFSSAEIAMFSIARHRIEALVEEGAPNAKTLQALKADPHRLLVTILVGNNLVNIGMSSLATGLLGLYVSSGEAVFAATFGVTTLVLLFGESAPKSYAIENTETWACSVSRPLQLTEYVLYPLVVTFDRLTRLVNRVTGGQANIETSYVTRDEIQELIRTGANEGVIDAGEREMLQRIFRFNDTIAKEVMTPRLDITAVARDDDVETAIQTSVRSGHRRLPVFGERLDDVLGVVTLDDLVAATLSSECPHDRLGPHVTEVLHVPESKSVDTLFSEMQQERVGMAIVIDEFGTTEGLITTEDLVEEIVGDILDAEEEEPITVVDSTTVLARGDVNIEAVNDTLGVDLPEGEEFETITGFVFNLAGRLVEAGESFTYEDVELRIERVESTRVMRVRITKPADRPNERHPVEAES